MVMCFNSSPTDVGNENAGRGLTLFELELRARSCTIAEAPGPK